MPVTSNRKITITLSSGLAATYTFEAAENELSPGGSNIYTLASGANTITVPGGGSVVTGATIIPPAGNSTAITLKGVTGDTGISIGITDPTSIAFGATPPASFVLTAGGTITGLRIIWT